MLPGYLLYQEGIGACAGVLVAFAQLFVLQGGLSAFLPQLFKGGRTASHVAGMHCEWPERPVDAETSVHVGISLGAAPFPLHASDADTLLATAYRAMYANKIHRRPTRLRTPNPGVAFGVVS